MASHCQSICLTDEQRDDLKLWLHFLKQAVNGISLNLLTFFYPTHIRCSNASEHGISGFSATTGIACMEMGNSSETAVASNTQCLGIPGRVHYSLDGDSCWEGSERLMFLSQTDSTSAAGWLRKSNFDDRDPLHLDIARETADLIMAQDSCLYSQWFRGKLNEVTDSLSRDDHLSDTDLMTVLHCNMPEQVPEDFKIYPLPPSVKLKIMTWLCSLPPAMQSPAAPQQSKIATGDIGRPTSRQSNSMMTHTSKLSPSANSIESLLDSVQPSATMTSRTTRVHQKLLHQFLEQSQPPSMLWHRPSGKRTYQVPAMTVTNDLHSFYRDASMDTTTKTGARNPRRQSHPE
jgi:hypothetical protein